MIRDFAIGMYSMTWFPTMRNHPRPSSVPPSRFVKFMAVPSPFSTLDTSPYQPGFLTLVIEKGLSFRYHRLTTNKIRGNRKADKCKHSVLPAG